MSTTGDPAKAIIETAVASGSGPLQVLEQLGTDEIEWYVTEQGDLAARVWQIVVEGFMSPEDVPLRQGNTPPPQADPLNWVSAHLDELRAQYHGQWIAVVGNQVQAAAPTLPALLALVNAQGLEKPFVTQVPTGELTWTMTYAGQIV